MRGLPLATTFAFLQFTTKLINNHFLGNESSEEQAVRNDTQNDSEVN